MVSYDRLLNYQCLFFFFFLVCACWGENIFQELTESHFFKCFSRRGATALPLPSSYINNWLEESSCLGNPMFNSCSAWEDWNVYLFVVVLPHLFMSMGYPFVCTLTLIFCPAKNIAAKNPGLVDQKTEGQKA